jgi:hypothetical protein
LAFSYWIDYLGFITEGTLAVVLITPSRGVPNWSVIYIINTAPSPASTDDDDRGSDDGDDRNAIMDFYAPETPSEEDPEEVVPHVSVDE